MDFDTKLYLKKDFQHVVLHIVGTPIRTTVYVFPKFLTKFIKDLCLFPHVFYPFLHRFVNNHTVFSRIQLAMENEPWVMDDNSFVPQPYFNKDIGPERLRVISLALQRCYGPGAPEHFFKRASTKQSENGPAGYSGEEEVVVDISDSDEHERTHAHPHEHESVEEIDGVEVISSKISELSFPDVVPSESASVSLADDSGDSFECVTPTAPSPIVSAGSSLEPLTATP